MLLSLTPAVRLWLLDLPDDVPLWLPCPPPWRSRLGSRGVRLPLLALCFPPPDDSRLRAAWLASAAPTGTDETSRPSRHSPPLADPSSCVSTPSPSGTKFSSTRPVYRPVRPVERSVCII